MRAKGRVAGAKLKSMIQLKLNFFFFEARVSGVERKGFGV